MFSNFLFSSILLEGAALPFPNGGAEMDNGAVESRRGRGVQGNPRREGFPWADLPVAAKRGRRCTPAVSDPPVLIDPSIHP